VTSHGQTPRAAQRRAFVDEREQGEEEQGGTSMDGTVTVWRFGGIDNRAF
jgi:hypothetical protein